MNAVVDLVAPRAAELLLAPAMDSEGQQAWREACYEAGMPLQICRDVAMGMDQALASAAEADAIAVLGSRTAAATARAQVLGLVPPGKIAPALHWLSRGNQWPAKSAALAWSSRSGRDHAARKHSFGVLGKSHRRSVWRGADDALRYDGISDENRGRGKELESGECA